MTAHWGVDDPAAVDGSEEENIPAFRDASWTLERRIRLFTSLRLESLDALSLRGELRRIGEGR